MEFLGKPGKTMVGSDSHTPAAGSLGMLAIGTGGLEVALAIAGEPFLCSHAQDFWDKAHRETARLGKWQGCDFRDAPQT